MKKRVTAQTLLTALMPAIHALPNLVVAALLTDGEKTNDAMNENGTVTVER
jgi:hypothetical protein